MAETKDKKEKPEPKPVDPVVFKEKIEQIVDELHRQAASRDFVTEIVNELNSSYGIKKPIIRKVAGIEFKRNLDEVTEESEEIESLVSVLRSRG